MFAVPCSWQPPPDAADAVGAKARTATTAASPVHIDFFDTSTSYVGHEMPSRPRHSSLSPAGSGNRRNRNTNKQSVCVQTSAGRRCRAGLRGGTGAFPCNSYEDTSQEEPGEGSMR